MGWPKGKKRDEAPAVQYVEPISEVAPAKRAEPEPTNSTNCRGCSHGEHLHYEGRDRQCNSSGCRCTRLVK